MAKRKPKNKKAASDLTVADLVTLAREVGLPEGALDGDLEDACDEESDLMKENIKGDTLYEQLEFLYMHGFGLQRLAEIIREAAEETELS